MVDHVSNVGNLGGNTPANKLKKAYQLPKAERGADAVQLSSNVMKVQGVSDIRMDKVMEVKRAIADGSYLTAEKLNLSLDKAIDDATADA